VIPLLVLLGLLAVGFLGPLWRPRCPSCRAAGTRVIQHGLPVWVCFEHDEDGALTFGLFGRLIMYLPFDGWLHVTPGPYLPGVWDWLFHGEHED
jgi:hypothetical protein